MGFLHSRPPPKCASEGCSEWARVYLKYCLCSTKDGVALTLGLLSVVSWGVAEVPQIITNHKTKSTEGLSMAFLTTWLVGDLFNLIGCFLEPATLPTQFYMALLYTATTVVLAWQTIYYGNLYHRVKSKSEKHKSQQEVSDRKESSTDNVVPTNDSEDSESGRSSPIPVVIKRYNGDGVDFYYTSARSLSRSPLPMGGSWATHSRQTPSLFNDQAAPLLGARSPMQSAPVTKNMLSVAPLVFFLVSAFSLWSSAQSSFSQSSDGMVIPVGRKLLQLELKGIMLNSGGGGGGNWIGTLLGWVMTAIYMGGRLPQIYLNIKRGNVEGLSPLMFTFALVGNATYVGSILVSSLEWSKIRPNLPWLVDAAGCVVLDSFIMMQFLYFHLRTRKSSQLEK